MTSIETVLKSKGPLLSSELSKLVASKESINYNTASQRVVRNPEIERIKGFFVSGQSLCFLKEHALSDILIKSLTKNLFESGRKYWYCLNAVSLHGGTISQRFLECYTNYPVAPLKSHIPFKKVMQNFVKSNILVFDGTDYHFSPKLIRQFPNTFYLRTIEAIKDDILENFHSLTRNTGMISYNSGEKFSEFGKFRWAFKGTSAVSGLTQNNKSGFLLADIVIGTPINENDILFFVDKLKKIKSFQNSSNILPFLIVDDLSKEALILLKRNGIVVGFIKELFGQKYAESLKELISILNNAGASLKKTPDKYLDLLKELKKYNEGLVNNIRGALFEFLVGHIHSTKTNSSIDIGREIVVDNARHEMDVLAVYPDEILIAECKATKSMIVEEDIEKWLGVKLPAFRKWISNQETWRKKKIKFEYWSVSGFTDDALSMLKERKASASKFSLDYFGSSDIRSEVLKVNNKKMKEALDDFFLKPNV
jgi:hypothetical protein